MQNKSKTLIIGIIASMIFGLTACGSTPNQESTPSPDMSRVESNVGSEVIAKYILNQDKVVNILNNTAGIAGNFDITTSEYRDIELEGTEYNVSKTNTITCKMQNTVEYLSDGFQINIILEYIDNNEYPNSVSITCEFSNDADSTTAQAWSIELIKRIFNSEISGHMSRLDYNGEPKDAGVLAGHNIKVYRGLDNLSATLGKYMLTYVVSIENDKIENTPNSFNPSLNPQYLLFNTGLISYNEKVETAVNRLTKMYDDSATGALTAMSDLVKDTGDIKYEQARFKMDIVSKENGYTTLDVTANTGEYNKLKISTKTLVYKTKLEAFYAAEDILLELTGTEVELEDKFDESEIKMEITESGFNESWGYPLEMTAAVLSLVGGGYQVVIDLNTLDNGGVAN